MGACEATPPATHREFLGDVLAVRGEQQPLDRDRRTIIVCHPDNPVVRDARSRVFRPLIPYVKIGAETAQSGVINEFFGTAQVSAPVVPPRWRRVLRISRRSTYSVRARGKAT